MLWKKNIILPKMIGDFDQNIFNSKLKAQIILLNLKIFYMMMTLKKWGYN